MFPKPSKVFYFKKFLFILLTSVFCFFLQKQHRATMLLIKGTHRILPYVHRSVLPNLRSYRCLAPYVSCYAVETKDKKQQASVYRSLFPVTGNCDRKALFVFKNFTSKAQDTEGSKGQDIESEQSEPDSEDNVSLLYRFNHISTASTITKVKIFQTVLVIAAVPYLYGYYLSGVVSYLKFMSSVGIMTFSTAMLYVLGGSISKIICVMKYNKDTDEVLISHLTFWGRRRDVSIPVSNIVPVSDSGENVTDTFIKVNTFDNSESFVIPLKDATEQEKEAVLAIIG